MKLVFHISEDGSEIDNVQLLGIEESKLIASDRIFFLPNISYL
jgi:hypothetical protein